jgi:hypothetical protein
MIDFGPVNYECYWHGENETCDHKDNVSHECKLERCPLETVEGDVER